MAQFSLSWTLGKGSHSRGGNQREPVWADIEALLDQVGADSGSVTLNLDVSENRSRMLQAFSDRGSFLLMLGEDDGQEYNVRSFNDTHTQPGQTEILGDLWNSRMVCQDFDIVKHVFREFFDNGNVSQDLLS